MPRSAFGVSLRLALERAGGRGRGGGEAASGEVVLQGAQAGGR